MPKAIDPIVDVIILGAGPAGTSVAIQCAKAGLNVTIIEREQFPRERPGETLHPGIEPLLRQLGVFEQLPSELLRHEGVWVQWEGDRSFVPYGADEFGTWRGFQVWRAELDSVLLRHAQELGVSILQPRQALQPIIQDNRVIGVVTSEGTLLSSFVIDATGGQHWLARKLGLKIRNHSPRLVAHYGYAEGECPLRDEAPALIADEQGWTWTARVRPQFYQWTRLTFKNERIDRDWLPKEFSRLKRSKTCAADVTWRIVTCPAGLGYFLVGDAAAVLDPASSHGVLKAIMSGIMAGYSVTQILNHAQVEHRVSPEYCQWVHNWFQHDVKRLQQLYASLPDPPNWALNQSCLLA